MEDKDLNELYEHGKDAGEFYPRNHLWVAYSDMDKAQDVQAALIDAGFECRSFSAETVRAGSEKGIASASLLSGMGASLKMVKLHHELALKGCAFLLIKAPDDEVAAQAMKVVRNIPFELAQRYHLLAIETLS